MNTPTAYHCYCCGAEDECDCKVVVNPYVPMEMIRDDFGTSYGDSSGWECKTHRCGDFI